MQILELRKKTVKELNSLVLEFLREQFDLRMQKGTGQLGKPNEVQRIRRTIARIKTVISEKLLEVDAH